MGESRTLRLRKETLTELTARDLRGVVGGGTESAPELTFCICTSLVTCVDTLTIATCQCPGVTGATCPCPTGYVCA